MMKRLVAGLTGLGMMALAVTQAHAMAEQTVDVVIDRKTGCWNNGGDPDAYAVEGDFKAGIYAFFRLGETSVLEGEGMAKPIQMETYATYKPTLTAITPGQQPTGQTVGEWKDMLDGYHVYYIPRRVHYMALFMKSPGDVGAGVMEICVRKQPRLSN